MGQFYTNITLSGTDAARVADAIRREPRWAFVLPRGEFTLLFDRVSERQDGTGYALAERLSRELGCLALYVSNHDDSVLYYRLYRHGTQVDDYDSCPNYFDGPDVAPSGGDADALAEAFGAPQARAQLADVLRYHRGAAKTDKRYVREFTRHQAIVAALGLPPVAVANGFDSIAQSGPPAGVDEDDLVLLCGPEEL